MERVEKARELIFLERLAEALTSYGAPVYAIEEALAKVGDRLNVLGSYIVMSGAYFSASGKFTEQTVTVARLPAGGFNIEKLNRTIILVHDLVEGSLTLAQAEERLLAIEYARPVYGKTLEGFSWWLAGGAIALLFGAGWMDAAVASVGSTFAFGISQVLSRNRNLARLIEPLSAVLVTLFVALCYGLFGGFSVPIAVVCGLIIPMPGFAFTRAMSELAMGHLLSGTARFVSAALTLLFLSAGTFVGFAIVKFFIPLTIETFKVVPPHPIALVLIAIPQTISLCMTFQVHWRHYISVIIVDIIAIFIMFYGGAIVGPALGCAVAAFIIVIVSNIYSHIRRCSSVVIKLPCILVLVPGSVGFNAVVAVLAAEPLAGISAGVLMLFTGLSIVVGSILADSIYPE